MKTQNMYPQKLIEEYRNPKYNQALINYTHKAKVQNLTCGDEITMYIRVKQNLIIDIGYEVQACAVTIATASLLSAKLLEMTLSDIKQLQEKDIFELLDMELKPSRQRCATLPLEAVNKALEEKTSTSI